MPFAPATDSVRKRLCSQTCPVFVGGIVVFAFSMVLSDGVFIPVIRNSHFDTAAGLCSWRCYVWLA